MPHSRQCWREKQTNKRERIFGFSRCTVGLGLYAIQGVACTTPDKPSGTGVKGSVLAEPNRGSRSPLDSRLRESFFKFGFLFAPHPSHCGPVGARIPAFSTNNTGQTARNGRCSGMTTKLIAFTFLLLTAVFFVGCAATAETTTTTTTTKDRTKSSMYAR